MCRMYFKDSKEIIIWKDKDMKIQTNNRIL